MLSKNLARVKQELKVLEDNIRSKGLDLNVNAIESSSSDEDTCEVIEKNSNLIVSHGSLESTMVRIRGKYLENKQRN